MSRFLFTILGKALLISFLALWGAMVYLNYPTSAQQRQDVLGSTVVINVAAPYPVRMTVLGHGSGVVIKQSPGHIVIVTAYHVVENLATTPGGVLLVSRTPYDLNGVHARLLGVSPAYDLAIIEIAESDFGPTVPARLCSAEPRIFNDVVAAGSPGPLPISVVTGIIANTAMHDSARFKLDIPLIQHTATLIAGFSGGGLFKYEVNYDLSSRASWCLQGINIQAISEYPTMNFAVSSEYLASFLNTLGIKVGYRA